MRWFVLLVVLLALILSINHHTEVDCPPWWKCNDLNGHNDPLCSCWDKR